MILIGLMSGTSADGIDAALVEIHGQGRSTRIRLMEFLCVPHAPAMRAAILAACKPGGTDAQRITALDSALGETFAEAALAVAERAGCRPESVDAIASHGQTIWHQPDPIELAGRSARGTLQIGSPAVIAARFGRPVISDFRAADMAAGGQGAPLVPFFDWTVLGSDSETRVVLNLGGIANITCLPRGGALDAVTAFDTGPCNLVIDGAARLLTDGRLAFDSDGALAAAGAADADWVGRTLREHPYFAQPPPKSTGRETFGDPFIETALGALRSTSLQDVVATMTLLAAESIAAGIRESVSPLSAPEVVIVGGGGTHNGTLMRMLAERLAPARLENRDQAGIPVDAREAVAFALLGYETLAGRPFNVPSATGASRSVVLGSITPAPCAG